MNPLLVLTRLDPLDDSLALQASVLGYAVLRIPVFATDPGPDLPSLPRRVASIGDGTAIAWTSRRAAEPLAHAFLERRGNGYPLLYTLGEESAAPLRRVGCAPLTPGEGARAADLARFIVERAPEDGIRQVLVLRGDRSLADLPSGLERAGIQVVPLEIYRTRFLDADVDGLTSWLEEGALVVIGFYSPSGVTGLERLLDAGTRDRIRTHSTVFARGATTATELRARGFRNVSQPEGDMTFERMALGVLEATLEELA